MNYTENYRLNQWDAEDRILREDFNRDNANVDSGLSTLKQGLETETRSREEAVSAAKQEAAQAVAAAKQEASEGLAALESSKADKTVLAQLQALVDAMPFVKLRAVTVSQAVNQVDVDMRDISLNTYSYLVIVPRLKGSETATSSIFYVRINQVADGGYEELGSSQDCLTTCRNMKMGIFYRLDLMELDGEIKAMNCSISSDSKANLSGSAMKKSVLEASQMQTINFVGEEGELVQPGSEIQIYGVKR